MILQRRSPANQGGPEKSVAAKLATDAAKPAWWRAKVGCFGRAVMQCLGSRMILIANQFSISLNRALSVSLKNLPGYFNSSMLQLFDFELRPYR